jgi:hypothetical protein
MSTNAKIGYTCGICGKTYESIEERATCEATCIVKRNDEAEKKKAQEHAAKRKESEQAIHDALSVANEMVAKHVKEYDTLSITKHYPYLNYIFKNSAWWF